MKYDAVKEVFQDGYPHNDLKQELLLSLQRFVFNSVGCAVLIKRLLSKSKPTEASVTDCCKLSRFGCNPWHEMCHWLCYHHLGCIHLTAIVSNMTGPVRFHFTVL